MNAHPAPPPSAKRRPSAWWFALPAGLLLAAAVIFGSFLFTTVSSVMRTDAEVPTDGATYEVSVPTGDERAVFVDQHATNPDCRFVDSRTGEELELRPYGGSFTRSNGDGEWRAAWRLDPGSGALQVTCTSAAASVPVQIAPPIDTARFAGGLAAAILLPMILGALAVLSLVVLAVLFVTRPPRSV